MPEVPTGRAWADFSMMPQGSLPDAVLALGLGVTKTRTGRSG